jgi:YVTN family beta-propeller protein
MGKLGFPSPSQKEVMHTPPYVSNQSLGQLHIIDISAAKLVKTLDICPTPQPPATSPDGTNVFVSCGDNTVRIVSTSSNTETANIPVGTGPGKPVASNTHAYVSNVSSNDVSVIDSATVTVVATIAVGLNPTTGVFGTGNQYSSFINNLYVPNRNAESISVISTSSNTVIATLTIPGQPQISEAAVAPVLSSVGQLLFA